MADFGLGTFSTTARTLDGSQSGFLDRDGTLYVDGDAAVTATTGTNWLSNHGFIYAWGAGHQAVDANGSVFELLNGVDGVIDAENPSDGTVDIDVTISANVVNHGTIHSMNNHAINFQDSDGAARFNLVNTGRITSNDGTAVDVDTGNTYMYLSNSGFISGESNGLVLTADIGNTSTQVLNNTGIIEGLEGTAISFSFGTDGNFNLSNSGTISGWNGALRTSRDTDVRILNSGLLEARGFGGAIDLDGGDDVIINTGTIQGEIYLGFGADYLDNNGGVINGAVDAGSGNDTLAGSDKSDDFAGGADNDTIVGRGGDDLLAGDEGDDFILGGAGNDDIEGGIDNDTINGNAGDDTILGDSGNDILVGQDGSDVLDGSDGLDTMDGGNGDDVLEGGADNDILRGRAGEDELAGGLGRDYLTGGQDADQFVFRALAETVVGALRDQILDFEQGVDLIVVAGLSPGVFEFVGTNAFAPSGNPELRLLETVTGSTIVQIDSDGDGTQDAEIRVANVTGLTADDFVL
jgi:Ca2+-binding RTX toxin-like protein